MDCRRWAHYLCAELERHGLPQSYIARVMDELGDHHSDLREQGMSDQAAVERLGNLSWLAGQMAERYRERTFAGRRPWLVFVALPVPLLIAAWALTLMLTLGVLWGVEALGVPHTLWDATTTNWFSWIALTALRFLPASLVILTLCHAARGARVSRRFPAVGVLLVALVAMMFQSTLAISGLPGKSSFSLGLTFGETLLSMAQISQLLVPIALAGAYGLFARNQREVAGAA